MFCEAKMSPSGDIFLRTFGGHLKWVKWTKWRLIVIFGQILCNEFNGKNPLDGRLLMGLTFCGRAGDRSAGRARGGRVSLCGGVGFWSRWGTGAKRSRMLDVSRKARRLRDTLRPEPVSKERDPYSRNDLPLV